jgi:hypothetical protein
MLKSGDTLLRTDLTRLSRSQELAPLDTTIRFQEVVVDTILSKGS